MIVPGSGLVKEQAEKEGLDKILIKAGFVTQKGKFGTKKKKLTQKKKKKKGRKKK